MIRRTVLRDHGVTLLPRLPDMRWYEGFEVAVADAAAEMLWPRLPLEVSSCVMPGSSEPHTRGPRRKPREHAEDNEVGSTATHRECLVDPSTVASPSADKTRSPTPRPKNSRRACSEVFTRTGAQVRADCTNFPCSPRDHSRRRAWIFSTRSTPAGLANPPSLFRAPRTPRTFDALRTMHSADNAP